MHRAVPLLVVLALLVAAPATAGAAPVPTAALRIAFTMPSGPGSVYSQAAGNCVLPVYGWSRDSTPRYVGLTEHPRGLLDVTGRSGEAIVPGEAIHVDRIFSPRPRALAATDVGIQLAGRRAYLTGTIRASRSYSARAARRVRLAQLHRVTLTSRSVRGTLVVGVRGRATMLAPLAGMFNRLRCRGPRVDEHPVRVGAPLGTVTATIVPARASAAPTSFRLGVELGGALPAAPAIEPTGGAQADYGDVRFAVAPGTRVTATCDADGCEPTDGSVPLVGGFDFTDGTRRLSVTQLELSLTGGRRTVTGTVAGTRTTIGAELSDNGLLTIGDALSAQLAATFGDPELGGYLVRLRLPLASLTPA
ncbi:MAG TPA: hypothetical protein VF250_11660 [Conexibacter sp.]